MSIEITNNAIRHIRHERYGTLGSLSFAYQDFPFGSIVPYDIDSKGRIVVFLSRIAEHYQNLLNNSKACLFVAENKGWENPRNYARATILGRFEPVEDEREELAASYWQRFPKSAEKAIAHDFVFFRARPERIRWIGGFGEIAWIEGNDYWELAVADFSEKT